MSELKRCPFCGRSIKPKYVGGENQSAIGECVCGLSFEVKFVRKKCWRKDFATVWNVRVAKVENPRKTKDEWPIMAKQLRDFSRMLEKKLGYEEGKTCRLIAAKAYDCGVADAIAGRAEVFE